MLMDLNEADGYEEDECTEVQFNHWRHRWLECERRDGDHDDHHGHDDHSNPQVTRMRCLFQL